MSFDVEDPLAWIAIVCIALATTIMFWFLAISPPLTRQTKVLLLFGIAVFPIGAAMSTGLVGFHGTTERRFCGGCHLMTPYTDDSSDGLSTSLASRHARNPMFGDRNCYNCHADYGMFATAVTKMGGMRHVYYYYLGGYGKLKVPESFKVIHINKPFPNHTCMQCHSTETPYFKNVPDHKGAIDEVRAEKLSCASSGCHGPAHPFSKVEGHKE
ncbi:MAG: NapC/NirT family cytochrome c [Myxococcota bacterium]